MVTSWQKAWQGAIKGAAATSANPSRAASGETLLAQKLARRGEDLDLEIRDRHDDLCRSLPKPDYLSRAIAHGLTWTGHARDDARYTRRACLYLDTGARSALESASDFAGRFGADKLVDALVGWYTIREAYSPATSRVKKVSGVKFKLKKSASMDFLSTCSAQELVEAQQKLYDAGAALYKKGALHGVGPWIFCGPFKIIAAHRKDLWSDAKLDEVWMPLGLEVNRGVRTFLGKGYASGAGLTASMLDEEEGGFIEGMTTLLMVHDLERKLAGLAKSRALHVNSGLFLYGKGGI